MYILKQLMATVAKANSETVTARPATYWRPVVRHSIGTSAVSRTLRPIPASLPGRAPVFLEISHLAPASAVPEPVQTVPLCIW
jgi:hypothetical protein